MNILKGFKLVLEAEASDGTEGATGSGPADGGSSASEVDWAGLSEGFDADDGGEGVETPEAPVPAAPAAPVVPSPTPAAPTAPQPAPAQSPALEGQPPAPAPAPAPAPSPTEPTPTEPAKPEPQAQPSAEDFKAARTAYEQQLVQQYALTPEQEELAITEPGKVLPQLAAQIQLATMEVVTKGIMEAIPRLVPQLVKQAETEAKAEDEFFTSFPDLKDEQGRQAVLQLGMAFRQVNPKATKAEFISKVGAAARAVLGRIPQDMATNAPPAPVIPPAPAGPGSVGAMPAPAASTNPFTLLHQQFLEED